MSKYEEASDEDLLQWIAEGERAFEALFARHKHELFRFLLQQVGDVESAKELLNDVMVAVRNGAASFKGEAKVRTWMIRIAKNKAVDAFRNPRRAGVQREDMSAIMNKPDPRDDPESKLQKKNLADRMQQALKMLSPEHRRVLCLTFYFEMPQQDIAFVEDIALGTVKSRVSFAKSKLGDALKGLGFCGDADD